MIVDNTIEYAFHFKSNQPIDGEIKEAILRLIIRNYQYEYDERRRYAIKSSVEGDLLFHGAFYTSARQLPKELNFTSDIRNTILYKLLRDHCILTKVECPKVIDENQVFCYMSQSDFFQFMDPCYLAEGVDLPEFEIIKRTKEPSRITERDLSSFI